MKIRSFIADIQGTSAVEFALTAPIYLLMLSVFIMGALLLWTQLGLQHGVESAARCASINPAMCGTDEAIQSYAASKAFGLTVRPSVFTSSKPSCGNQVTASYVIPFNLYGLPSPTLTAQACFPS
jgi:Flp pilus assembly protein TadG